MKLALYGIRIKKILGENRPQTLVAATRWSKRRWGTEWSRFFSASLCELTKDWYIISQTFSLLWLFSSNTEGKCCFATDTLNTSRIVMCSSCCYVHNNDISGTVHVYPSHIGVGSDSACKFLVVTNAFHVSGFVFCTSWCYVYNNVIKYTGDSEQTNTARRTLDGTYMSWLQ